MSAAGLKKKKKPSTKTALVALQPCLRYVVSHCEASHSQIRQLVLPPLFFGCIF